MTRSAADIRLQRFLLSTNNLRRFQWKRESSCKGALIRNNRRLIPAKNCYGHSWSEEK